MAILRLSSTVQVVPPVTHKVLLGEDGPIWAEEAGGLSAGWTDVEGLKSSQNKSPLDEPHIPT